MKYKWLNKKNNKEMIIFFNGWGMDESIVKHLSPEGYDIIMFYDYNDLNLNFNFDSINMYSSIHLIAWSMGVMISTLFDKINYSSKTAINGTLKPIDDSYGIPKRIYDLTINNFTPDSLTKFIKNMEVNTDIIPQIHREFENQRSELIALKNYQSNFNFTFDRIILSNKDKIIPAKNQSAYWKIEPNTNSGHSPFHLYKKWSELL